MARVDFYSLPRPVQERFVDSSRAAGIPSPLLREPPRERTHHFWAAGACVAALGFFALLAAGFGDLESPLALASSPMIAAYTACLAGAAFCALRALAIRRAISTRPYHAGLFLFPMGVVDARREPFEVWRLGEVSDVQVVDPASVRIETAGGQAYLFRANDGDHAEQVKEAMGEARARYARAEMATDRRELARLDPLVDSGFSNPFSPKLPIVRRVPVWDRLSVPIAAALGIVMGVGVWSLRNQLSEQRLYERATSADSVDAYRAYLARGGSRSEVPEILLPRAELRLAQQEGTVAAIERYMEERPDVKIRDEVEAALREALLAELREAQRAGSLSSLAGFRTRQANHQLVEAELMAATQALYDEALEAFRRAAPQGAESVIDFFRRLLKHAQKHGPQVSVRFVRRIPESVGRADAVVKKSAYYMGEISIPSRYFDEVHARRREEKFGRIIVERLQRAFPEDILSFELGQPLDDPEELPEPEHPTLFIEHRTEMAGGYMSRNPRGVFVGVGLMFEAAFRLPGGGEGLTFKHSTWRSPKLGILKEENAKVGDVYEAMAGDGFERFVEQYLVSLFRSP